MIQARPPMRRHHDQIGADSLCEVDQTKSRVVNLQVDPKLDVVFVGRLSVPCPDRVLPWDFIVRFRASCTNPGSVRCGNEADHVYIRGAVCDVQCRAQRGERFWRVVNRGDNRFGVKIAHLQ